MASGETVGGGGAGLGLDKVLTVCPMHCSLGGMEKQLLAPG
jgi:hypothetical protein